MASSAEISKTETSATTEDEEGKDITEEEDEDKDKDEAIKSGRFSVEKSKKTPSGDTSKSPGTGKATPSSKQKSITATARSTVKTTQEASTGTATSLLHSTTPPSTSIRSPTYITVPSTAGIPTYVYHVLYTESGETSRGSQRSSAVSHITKGTVASTVSQAVKSKVTSTLQSTCVSAQRSICAAMAKKEQPVEEPKCPMQPECPPNMQECYEDIKDKLCDLLTYDTIHDMGEKIWDGFLIMGGGFGKQRVRACKD